MLYTVAGFSYNLDVKRCHFFVQFALAAASSLAYRPSSQSHAYAYSYLDSYVYPVPHADTDGDAHLYTDSNEYPNLHSHPHPHTHAHAHIHLYTYPHGNTSVDLSDNTIALLASHVGIAPLFTPRRPSTTCDSGTCV